MVIQELSLNGEALYREALIVLRQTQSTVRPEWQIFRSSC